MAGGGLGDAAALVKVEGFGGEDVAVIAVGYDEHVVALEHILHGEFEVWLAF